MKFFIFDMCLISSPFAHFHPSKPAERNFVAKEEKQKTEDGVFPPLTIKGVLLPMRLMGHNVKEGPEQQQMEAITMNHLEPAKQPHNFLKLALGHLDQDWSILLWVDRVFYNVPKGERGAAED